MHMRLGKTLPRKTGNTEVSMKNLDVIAAALVITGPLKLGWRAFSNLMSLTMCTSNSLLVGVFALALTLKVS
jgi:hypothetical protein